MSWTSERNFVDVFLCHKNLIVSGIAIHKTDHFVPSSSIYQHISYRHRVTIHRCSFVEIPEINAHSWFAILLVNRNHIRNPFGITTLPNKTSFNKPCNLGLYIWQNLSTTSPRSLLVWPIY